LGNEAHEPDRFSGADGGGRPSEDVHRAVLGPAKADEVVQKRRLAGSVPSHERDYFAFAKVEAYVRKRRDRTVSSGEALYTRDALSGLGDCCRMPSRL
jgi:hypothetical protein